MSKLTRKFGRRQRRLRIEESDPGWGAIRKNTLERAGWRCLRCRTRARLTAHHLLPRERGGKSVESNLVCLCEECHDWAEVWLEEHYPELMPWDTLTANPSEPPEKKPWQGWTRERWLRAIHRWPD